MYKIKKEEKLKKSFWFSVYFPYQVQFKKHAYELLIKISILKSQP